MTLFLSVALVHAAKAPASRPAAPTTNQVLAELLRILPKSEPWENWLKGTRAEPPNFDELPSIPFLPDPLRFENGKPVRFQDWPRRRQEILLLFQKYVLGTFPGSPGNVIAVNIQRREEPGAMVEEVTLRFGPEHRAQLHMELIIPPGPGPFPVFMTQATHRRWALLAVSRGYIGCVYAGADARDDTGPWRAIWPEYDWTKLARRAWAASRCLDYLHTLPHIDTNRIALAGHSRNGQTALMAAAVDQRFDAVISSSSGAGGVCTYRFFSETQFGEGIELITRQSPDWLHPRLRFFAGRENKLPIDQHQLIACIAPRPCLISTALNDNVESVWAVEHTLYSAGRVYELLYKRQELNLRYRPGGHETRAGDIEAYVDWLDSVFKRANYALPDSAFYPTYAAWRRFSGEEVDTKSFPTNGINDLLKAPDGTGVETIDHWVQKRADIRDRILWALGEAPSYGESKVGSDGAETKHHAVLLNRAEVPAGLERRSINFGNYIAADLYFPTNDGPARKLPAIVWLHPVSISHGYAGGHRRGEHPHLALAKLGFAVLAFDQIGNGSRLEEAGRFYQRYPHWSLLGKQVEDTLAALEALLLIDFIDQRKIYLLGYSTGAKVALHAAALDERIAGVISVAGFTPMRLDTAGKGTGGIARWSHWYPLQPRLGAFQGHEAHIPYDYHEVLAMIAPRPVTIFAPRIDVESTLEDVKACVEEAQKLYGFLGVKPHLQFQVLEDYNHFSPETQKVVYERLKDL